MKAPSISIIIPVYNAEKYLERCMASVQAQTFADFEALFIDDRSTDSSREIVRAYQSSDNRIRLIELEKNGGSGIARNIGIENARGEYLSFMDADDAVSPDFLEQLYKKAKETGADIVKGLCVYCAAGGDGYEVADNIRAIKAQYDRGTKLFAAFVNGHWSAIYRRGFIEAHSIRYGETRVSHDVVFLLRAGYFAGSFEIAPEAKYYYFDIAGSAVHTFSYGRFHASMLAVGEIVDFINQTDPYSEELTAFLSAFLMRQLPVHSYLCVKPELKDKAPEFLENLHGILLRFKNLSRLAETNYAVRAFMELGEENNIAPAGMIVGLNDNLPWRLFAFERLIAHINSERADKAAAMKLLCISLANIERRFIRDGANPSEEEFAEFYKKMHAILLKLNDRAAFIERGGLAAKTMLEYGVNLFPVTAGGRLTDAAGELRALKRLLDIMEAHPDPSGDRTSLASRLAGRLLDRAALLQKHAPGAAARLSFELAAQLKRINALTQ